MSFDVEKQWKTQAGYDAVCILIHDMHRCGYVGVPKEHPLHGKDHSEHCDVLVEPLKELLNSTEPMGKRGVIPFFCMLGNTDKAPMDVFFNVHGSITYCGGDDYPIDNPHKLWFIGFDCGHDRDGKLGKMARYSTGPVRTMEYVVEECESLAKQLHAVATLK